MDFNGNVNVIAGASELGQGVETVLAQIVAEEIGIDIRRITVVSGDTSNALPCAGAWGSRSTFLAGNAAKDAANQIRQILLNCASELLEADVGALECFDEKIYVKGSPRKAVTYSEIARSCCEKGVPIRKDSVYNDVFSDFDIGDKAAGYENPNPTYSFCAQGAEVEVDVQTGKVKVLKFVAAHDVGKAINPMAIEGQIEGGVAQGIGFALCEEILFKNGEIINPTFLDYKVLSSLDMPNVKSIIVESDDPEGPFGAKGVGELSTIPTAAVIANAVYDGIGIRVRKLPITPEHLIELINARMGCVSKTTG